MTEPVFCVLCGREGHRSSHCPMQLPPEMRAAKAIRSQQPMLAEAREYCMRFGIENVDELERVRLSIVQREFLNRCAPWRGMLAKLAAYETNLQQPSPAYLHTQDSFREVIAAIAIGLGIELWQLEGAGH